MESQIEITDEEHEKYVEAVKQNMDLVDKQSQDFRLNLYAHGRQGKLGDNNEPKPGTFQIKEKYKWEAWGKLKGMDK